MLDDDRASELNTQLHLCPRKVVHVTCWCDDQVDGAPLVRCGWLNPGDVRAAFRRRADDPAQPITLTVRRIQGLTEKSILKARKW